MPERANRAAARQSGARHPEARRPEARRPVARRPASRRLILASGSPRRLALLEQIGLTPIVIVPDVDEQRLPDETPGTMVARLAAAKADHVLTNLLVAPADAVVLAADTSIELDGEPLGKPVDRVHALAILAALSGREHRVVTGVAVHTTVTRHAVSVTSAVQFAPIDSAAAAAYWDTGEPAGKAGAYAVQGLGAVFVERLNGSYSNVVGLPLFETANLLHQAGISVLVAR